MKDLATAFALALVLEGVAYALFPEAMKRMLARMMDMPPEILRGTGLALACLGVLLAWVLRSAINAP